MTETRNQPHERCGAKNRQGNPCKRAPMPNGRCNLHGGKATGPRSQEGNQNATKHGLFGRALGPVGLEVYQAAKEVPAEELTRDSAEFLIAKVVEAYEVDPDLDNAFFGIRAYLRKEIQDGNITKEAAVKVLQKLEAPDIGTLARALAPLKGLLEAKKQGEGGEDGDVPAITLQPPEGRTL